jgi:hypothetical protein
MIPLDNKNNIDIIHNINKVTESSFINEDDNISCSSKETSKSLNVNHCNTLNDVKNYKLKNLYNIYNNIIDIDDKNSEKFKSDINNNEYNNAKYLVNKNKRKATKN